MRKDLLHIDDSRRDYTLAEFIDLGIELLSTLKETIPQEELVYPGREVFFTIADFVRALNTFLTGEVYMKQVRSRHYSFTYHSEKLEKQRAKHKQLIDLAKSAIQIESITGKLPEYAKTEKYAHIIDDLKMGIVPKPPQVAVDFYDDEDVHISEEAADD